MACKTAKKAAPKKTASKKKCKPKNIFASKHKDN